jgi:circadian clock protein KaiC
VADALAERMLAAIRARGVCRLFIDGIGAFKDSIVYPERTARFFSALCNELRARGVVTILSDETKDLIGPAIEIPVTGLTAMLDNIVFLRHVEESGRRRRIISVMKTREGPSDPTLREFSIGARGFEVSPAARPAGKRRGKGRRP